MAKLPQRFLEEYESRGDTFFEIAQLLYDHHGQQFTNEEIGSEFDYLTQRRVEQITETLAEDGWLSSREGPMTLVWNTERYNPAETVPRDALFGLYRDLGAVFKKHTATSTGVYAILGFICFTAAIELTFLHIVYVLSGYGGPSPGLTVYLALGLVSALMGLILSLIAPLQATVNRFIDGLRT